MVRSSLRLALSNLASIACIVVLSLVLGCSSPQPTSKALPTKTPLGFIEGGVNTRLDETAPQFDSAKKALLFTRNLVRIDSTRTDADSTLYRQQLLLAVLADNLSSARISRNDTITDNNDINYGSAVDQAHKRSFLSSSHIPSDQGVSVQTPDEEKLPIDSSFGGSDIYERIGTNAKNSGTFRNLGSAVNSRFWDAHPTYASNGDSLLLIFASDRPVHEDSVIYRHGFSMPYRNQKSAYDSLQRDSVFGNSDLYYAFCIEGKWYPAQNLNDISGLRDSINTKLSEYSPFIYCPHIKPVLYFSSQGHQDTTKSKGNGNIFSVCLQIDYRNRSLRANNFQSLPRGNDAVNADSSDERFPCVIAERDSLRIFFSSNRDSKGLRIDSSQPRNPRRIVASGGYDLYSMLFKTDAACECRMPVLKYHVVLKNLKSPKDRILKPFLIVVDSSTAHQDTIHTDEYTCEIRPKEAKVFRGGSYQNENCSTTKVPTIAYYCFSPKAPIFSYDSTFSVVSKLAYRKLDRADTSFVRREVNFDRWKSNGANTSFDPCVNLKTVNSAPLQLVRESKTVTDTLIKWRVDSSRVDTVRQSILSHIQRRFSHFETNNKSHTKTVDTACSSDLSIAWQSLTYAHFHPSKDTTVEDTIWIQPKYISPGLDLHLDSLNLEAVPYFQTAYWKVNTVRDLDSMYQWVTKPEFASDSAIELHPGNQYWKPSATGLRSVRYDYFRCAAAQIDTSITNICNRITSSWLSAFLYYRDQMALRGDTVKLVFQIDAYSDERGVEFAYYIGDSVHYISSSLDVTTSTPIQFSIRNLNQERIKNRSSLSKNNDTLSRLRAYYGFRVFTDRLRSSRLFDSLERTGAILCPDRVSSVNDFANKLQTSDIIFSVKGRRVDAREINKETPGCSDIDSVLKHRLRSSKSIKKYKILKNLKYDFNRRVALKAYILLVKGGKYSTIPPIFCKIEE